MPLLQVRDMPKDLYEKLAAVAAEDNRSVAQETVYLLREALQLKESHKARRKKVLEEIGRHAVKRVDKIPDAAGLIRDDRQR